MVEDQSGHYPFLTGASETPRQGDDDQLLKKIYIENHVGYDSKTMMELMMMLKLLTTCISV